MSEQPIALAVIIRTGRYSGQRYRIFDGMVIGRGSQAHVYLPDSKASRRHAVIAVGEEGVHLNDLSSHNGTWVNGERVTDRELQHTDMIQIGESRLEVVADSVHAPISDAIAPPTIVLSARMERPPTLDEVESEQFLTSEGLPTSLEIESGDRNAASVALTKARHYALVVAVARALGAGLRVDQIISRSLDLLLRVIGGDAAYVVLVDPATGNLIPHSGRGQDGGDVQFEASSGVLEWVVKKRTAVVSSNATEDDRFNQQRSVVLLQMGSFMAAPMLLGDRVLGVVQLVDNTGRSGFSDEALELLRVIAPVLATALENAQLIELKEDTIEQLQLAHEKLIDTQRQLLERERMAALGRFSSGLAHEVRNLMGPFMLADLLRTKYPEDSELQEVTYLMTEAYERIAAVVEETRQLTKGELGQKLNLTEGSMDEVVHSAVRLAQCDARTRAHNVSIDIPEHADFQFDVGRIKQVLLNLIRNASDAMVEPGEITVAARYDVEQDVVLVSVRDTGCGIPEDQIAEIWEPFMTTKGQEGTGLGLDFCRAIVEAHEGQIRCESVESVGSTFVFSLPLK